ncbi:tyrosine-type recombinase/integrase [Nonomuraea polychroma]|uniref:tyrosine-type recombinase/integrase n=1 Tax=Nonomuraea polychroma TaxID=46176 RepID=UPI003D8F8EF1
MEDLGPDVHHSDGYADRAAELQPGLRESLSQRSVPRIRVHDTRHTCASLLAALDVHPRVAMRILRHSQISMTMDVYTQIPSPETRRALDRLNKSLTTDQNA